MKYFYSEEREPVPRSAWDGVVERSGMNDLRWIFRDSVKVLQKRVRKEKQVYNPRYGVSDPYDTEVTYVWEDVPIEYHPE